MGSNKQEKKIKKRNRGPVETDDPDTNLITKMNKEDVVEAIMKPSKSKKARKVKSKDNPSSSVSVTEVNDAEDSFKKKKKKSKKISQESVDHLTNEKTESATNVLEVATSDVYKSKKARNNKNRDNSSSNKKSSAPRIGFNDADGSYQEPKKKSKSRKVRKEKDTHSKNERPQSVKAVQEVITSNIHQISSGDEDDSKGMKKWIKEYHERRPGIKILQDQIDDFITAHEEREEQERKEREAKLSEEGWTVVVHRKGGKRTSDPESGIAVGAVAEAAVLEKISQKKKKDLGLDFYRFQRKEAHRSEVMKLQSKFEEDKKRIQQIRAARKFKPY